MDEATPLTIFESRVNDVAHLEERLAAAPQGVGGVLRAALARYVQLTPSP